MSEGINDREVRRIREQQAERHVAPDPQEMIRRQAHPSSGRTTIFRVNADDEIVACGEFHMERMDDDLIWFRIGDRSFNLAAVNGAIKWLPHDPDTWEVDDAPPPEETGGVTKPQPTTDDVARWVRRAFDAEDALHAERERAERWKGLVNRILNDLANLGEIADDTDGEISRSFNREAAPPCAGRRSDE